MYHTHNAHFPLCYLLGKLENQTNLPNIQIDVMLCKLKNNIIITKAQGQTEQ